MKIAIDISPLESGHKVRGVGFYLKYLKEALVTYFPDHDYTFFTNPHEITDAVDIIHFPYFDPFFLTLPLRKRGRTVVTVHDLTPLVFPQVFPPGLKGRIRWEIQKRALSRADAIITDSLASKEDVIRFTGIQGEKIHAVYLAAGDEFTSTQLSESEQKKLRKKYLLPESFLLYVGDVTWNKNLPGLLRAVEEADVPLVMVGKALTETDFDREHPWNADRVTISELAEKNKNVFRLGFIPTEDVVRLYKSASAVILPSFYEGFGLPVIEAMSCGTPVITTKKGSLPEVAGDAAYLIDPESISDMAKGIRKVLGDKILHKELREKGLQQAKKFSWKKTAAATLKVYEK